MKIIVKGIDFRGRVKLGIFYIYLYQGLDFSCLGYMLYYGFEEVSGIGMFFVEFYLNVFMCNFVEICSLVIKYSIIQFRGYCIRGQENGVLVLEVI